MRPAAEPAEEANDAADDASETSAADGSLGPAQGGLASRLLPRPAKEEKKLSWKSYGSTFGLWLEALASGASNFLLIVTLMVNLQRMSKTTRPCELGSSGLETTFEVAMCEYTQAYMNTFPAIGGVVLVLQITRGVLQKRLYYGLLQEGGVLCFDNNMARRDPLMWALVVNLLHTITFTVLQFVGISRGIDLPGSALSPHPHHGEDISHHMGAEASFLDIDPPQLPYGLHHRVKLPNIVGRTQTACGNAGVLKSDVDLLIMMATTMVPMILVVVFLFLAHNIEQTLVPLSEYLLAYEEVGKSKPPLHTLRDALVMRYVHSEPGPISSKRSDLNTYYQDMLADLSPHAGHRLTHGSGRRTSNMRATEMVKFAMQNRLPSVGLMQAFWPAKVVLAQNGAWIFRLTYVLWVTLSVLWWIWIQVEVIFVSWTTIKDFLEGNLDAFLPMSVIVFYSAILARAIFVNLAAMSWVFRKSPSDQPAEGAPASSVQPSGAAPSGAAGSAAPPGE